jgi:hypothetical protein
VFHIVKVGSGMILFGEHVVGGGAGDKGWL